MAYVKANDVDPLDPIVASRIQRIIDNQEDHETRILAKPLAKVGHLSCPASTGNFSVTGVGFQPKLVRFFGGGFPGGSPVALWSNNGVMAADGTQSAFSASSRESVSGSAARASNRCLLIHTMSGAGALNLVVGAEFVSMDADGFTINFLNTNASYDVTWEAIG